jgi:hypothetical protein
LEIAKDSRQLVSVMRRPEYGGPLRFLEAERPGNVRRALSLKPQDMDWSIGRLGALVIKLPAGGAVGAQRGRQRRLGYVGQGSVLRAYASAVRSCPEIASEIKGERMIEVARKLARYENLRQKAATSLNGALDLRLLLAGQQVYMLQQVLRHVVARLSAADCTPKEAERLQSKFSKLLLHKEMLLQDQAQGRMASAAQREEMQAEIERVERRILVNDVKEAIRQRRPVDPENLEAAARYNREMEAEAARAKEEEEAQKLPGVRKYARRH